MSSADSAFGERVSHHRSSLTLADRFDRATDRFNRCRCIADVGPTGVGPNHAVEGNDRQAHVEDARGAGGVSLNDRRIKAHTPGRVHQNRGRGEDEERRAIVRAVPPSG